MRIYMMGLDNDANNIDDFMCLIAHEWFRYLK